MKLLAQHMKTAFQRLSEKLTQDVTLIMGGGGAMILAHGFTLGTSDIDAFPKGIELQALDELVKEIAREQGLPTDWLNPYFATYSHTLPSDYGNNLIEVFNTPRLRVMALGKEEMLIMKCFAHRPKDVGHAKALLKAGADADRVGTHISSLLDKGIPGAQQALDFLDDVLDQM